MKANELRLNNYIYNNKGEVEQVYTIYDESINGYDGNAGIYPDNENEYNPIPLTEEWLLRFGFKGGWSAEYENYIWQIEANKPYDLVLEEYSRSNECIEYMAIECLGQIEVQLKYVHQLQNLFYCLCGEELKLK